jgi:hypothetical protein
VFKAAIGSRCWLLTPVILAIWEAERDWEDHKFQPAQTKRFRDLISTEKAGHGGMHLSSLLWWEV